MFQGFDYVLAEAAKFNIRLTPVLLNLWNDDGVPLFEKFCGSDSTNVKPAPAIDLREGSTLNETERIQTPYVWYTSADCRGYVKDFITKVVTRKNSITGVAYRDDPTIFSWNLLNEPRCKYCGPEAVTEWYHDIAAHIKSVDPNHLVTTGEEGFFDESSKYAAADPTDGNLWGPRSGQDFVANHDSPDIDYAVIHLWPNNWAALDIDFGKTWVSSHVRAAQELGKPLVVEEFGKAVSDENQIASVRNPWYSLVYDAAARSIASGGPLRGAMFWLWDGTDTTVQTNPIIVSSGDDTMRSIILPFAQQQVGVCGSLGGNAAAAPAAEAPAAEVPTAEAPAAEAPAPQETAPEEATPSIVTLVAAAGRKLLAKH